MSIVKIWSKIKTSQIQAQINSHWIPRLDPVDSKTSFVTAKNIYNFPNSGIYIAEHVQT